MFFYFLVLKWLNVEKCLKVVGKLFLMIKNGPGFMVSQMPSLFNIVVAKGTKELTYDIATQSFMRSY